MKSQKKASAAISALKRIRSYISQDTAARVYQGLIIFPTALLFGTALAVN